MTVIKIIVVIIMIRLSQNNLNQNCIDKTIKNFRTYYKQEYSPS